MQAGQGGGAGRGSAAASTAGTSCSLGVTHDGGVSRVSSAESSPTRLPDRHGAVFVLRAPPRALRLTPWLQQGPARCIMRYIVALHVCYTPTRCDSRGPPPRGDPPPVRAKRRDSGARKQRPRGPGEGRTSGTSAHPVLTERQQYSVRAHCRSGGGGRGAAVPRVAAGGEAPGARGCNRS